MKTINVGEVAVFDHVEPSKEQALKPLEEAAEVFGAWQELEEAKSAVDKVQIISEIADTIQACVNLASALGVTNLTYAMKDCKNRNIKRRRITKEKPEALDADGVPIEVGDTVYPLFDGKLFPDTEPWHVARIKNSEEIYVEEGTGLCAARHFTHRKPDSWEQLEADSKLYCCEYFGRSYKKCLGCQADDPNYHPYDCNKAKTQDIVRRAKALAGVDDE